MTFGKDFRDIDTQVALRDSSKRIQDFLFGCGEDAESKRLFRRVLLHYEVLCLRVTDVLDPMLDVGGTIET